jgi:hypothetical protein
MNTEELKIKNKLYYEANKKEIRIYQNNRNKIIADKKKALKVPLTEEEVQLKKDKQKARKKETDKLKYERNKLKDDYEEKRLIRLEQTKQYQIDNKEEIKLKRSLNRDKINAGKRALRLKKKNMVC